MAVYCILHASIATWELRVVINCVDEIYKLLNTALMVVDVVIGDTGLSLVEKLLTT